MGNRVEKTAEAVYFIVLAALMYYFLQEVLQLRIYITFRHIFALILVFSAFVCFLLRPNIARGVTAVKDGLILSAPLLVILAMSCLIWVANHTDADMIFRGLSTSLIYMNQATAAFAAMAFLYLFGGRGVWYNLISLLAANLLMIATIMSEYGVGAYLSDLWNLIRTFADETGSVIIHAEIHELAFCVGAYLLYMLLHLKKSLLFYVLLGLAAFCFLSAFKRIAMAAMAAALAVGLLLKLLEKLGREKLARRLMWALTILMIILLVAYIAAVRLGVFTWLEKAGVDTMGRASAYEMMEDQYQVSPLFLGHGIGHLTYLINETDLFPIGMDTVHNDFLQYYIDLGFWGYLLWLLSLTALRLWYFGRRGDTSGMANVFSLTVFLVLVSTTDNTLNFQLFYTTIAILMAAPGFDARTARQEEMLLGYVSHENRPRKEGGLL